MTEERSSGPQFLYGAEVRFYQDADTRLYQPGPPEEVEKHRAEIAQYLDGLKPWAEMTLEEYQNWGKLDWKEPHFTWEATERLTGKIWEEGFIEAPAEFDYDFDEIDGAGIGPGEEVRRARISELGDALWCANALASQVRQSTEYATAHHLLDLAGNAHTPLRLGDLDEAVESGVRPRSTDTLWNSEDSDFDELDPSSTLHLLVPTLRMIPLQAYGYGEAEVYSQPRLINPLPFRDSLGRLTYFTAYWAHRWAKSSMAEVVEYNVRKLTDRVHAGTIDRKDQQ
jgi:hypothetical protein